LQDVEIVGTVLQRDGSFLPCLVLDAVEEAREFGLECLGVRPRNQFLITDVR
jgi:hypothetical protein